MKKHDYFLIFIILLLFKPFSTFSQIHEGDTAHFWSVSYIDWPPLWGVPQHDITAVCKKKGQHCSIMVETTAIQPSQGSIDSMTLLFDHDFYPSLTAKYGPIPDVFDHDTSVFLLVMTEHNWSGYFDPAQQMTDSMVFSRWGRHSSEHEIIYIAAQDFEPYAQGIISHEFGHLLHWGRDHSPEPPAHPVTFWEDAFIDEGFSTFAAIYLTEDIFQRSVPDYSAFFNSNPDIPLIWFTNYNQVKLFMLFMFEHYGQWNYVTELINNQLNGIPGVDSTLHALGFSEHFDDVFEQWSVANFIDDSLYDGGKYEYAHYKFPPCLVNSEYNTYPLSTENGSLSAFGSDYISFRSDSPKNVSIHFHGEAGKKFCLAFIQQDINTGRTLKVDRVFPDVSNYAAYHADSLDISYNRLIMDAMCIDSTVHYSDSALYSYSVSDFVEGINEISSSEGLLIYPNPASDNILVKIPGDQYKRGSYILYDYTGKCVMSGITDNLNISLNVSMIKSGLYYFKYTGIRSTYGGRFIRK